MTEIKVEYVDNETESTDRDVQYENSIDPNKRPTSPENFKGVVPGTLKNVTDELEVAKQARQDEEKKLAQAIEMNKKCDEKLQSSELQSKSPEEFRLS